MARLAVTFTVIFFLFAFSHARTPLDLPEKDVVSHDPSITLPESDTKTTILLPSEKPDSEPNTVVELEPDTTAATPLEIETATESVDELDLNQPFTVVTFRPINRHFPHIRGDRQSPFRVPHPCRHHHRHHFGRFNGGPREISYGNDMIIPREDDHRHNFGDVNGGPSEISFENDMILPREDGKADQMFHGDEVPKSISYGNDMIIPREEDKADPMFHGDEEQKIPARWVRFHHHGRPRFPFRHERWNKEEMMKRPFHHHHHHHHHHMEDDEVAEEHKEGGLNLMKRVRKFLNHF